MKKPMSGAAEGSRRMQSPITISGENDLFDLAHIAELTHPDFPLFGSGQSPHDGRLDDGNQGHIGIGGHGDGAQQIGGELARQEDGRGAVGPADDADGRGVEDIEMDGGYDFRDHQGPDQGGEDAELSRCPQKGGSGIGDQRAEVGHGPDAHENQQRKSARLDAHYIDEIKDSARFGDAGKGDVGQNAAESHGHQQQGLKPLADGQKQHQQPDPDHDQAADPGGPAADDRKKVPGDPGGPKKFGQHPPHWRHDLRAGRIHPGHTAGPDQGGDQEHGEGRDHFQLLHGDAFRFRSGWPRVVRV